LPPKQDILRPHTFAAIRSLNEFIESTLLSVFLNKPFTQNISICDLFASKKPLGSLDAATVATPIFQHETSA
jgi:hypothetical protein